MKDAYNNCVQKVQTLLVLKAEIFKALGKLDANMKCRNEIYPFCTSTQIMKQSLSICVCLNLLHETKAE